MFKERTNGVNSSSLAALLMAGSPNGDAALDVVNLWAAAVPATFFSLLSSGSRWIRLETSSRVQVEDPGTGLSQVQSGAGCIRESDILCRGKRRIFGSGHVEIQWHSLAVIVSKEWMLKISLGSTKIFTVVRQLEVEGEPGHFNHQPSSKFWFTNDVWYGRCRYWLSQEQGF